MSKKALRSGEGRGVEGEGSGGVEARNYCWDLQVVFQFCFSFQLCFANFIYVSSFRLWVSEDCMCITVQALRFWLWVFRFSQLQAVWELGFSILCNLGFQFSFCFCSVSFCFCSVSGSFLPWFGLGA